MDTYLAVTSKRDERRYADAPVSQDVIRRIVDAGRVAGSSRNQQRWVFVVVEGRERLERLSGFVYAPDNVRTAAFAVAIAMPGGSGGFDVGRAGQNMMLTAWNEGVISCPNGLADADGAAAELGLEGDYTPVTILSFGLPATPRDPEARTAEEWSARANRKPLAEVVRGLG